MPLRKETPQSKSQLIPGLSQIQPVLRLEDKFQAMESGELCSRYDHLFTVCPWTSHSVSPSLKSLSKNRPSQNFLETCLGEMSREIWSQLSPVEPMYSTGP